MCLVCVLNVWGCIDVYMGKGVNKHTAIFCRLGNSHFICFDDVSRPATGPIPRLLESLDTRLACYMHNSLQLYTVFFCY